MVHEDIQIRKARNVVVPGTTRNNTGIPDIPDIVQQEQPSAAVGYNTSIPLLVCAENLPENENASKEVTSNEVTDEITGEDSDDYTDDFETEFEESDSVQSSSIHPRDWDEELNSSKRCALEELKKLQLGN